MSAGPAPQPDFRQSRVRVTFLLEADLALRGSLELDTTLATLTRLVVPRLADWCVVDLLEPGVGLRRAAGAHRDPGKRLLLAQGLGHTLSGDAGWGPANVAAGTKRSVILPYAEDPAVLAGGRSAEELARIRALGLGAVACLPIRRGDVIHGVLSCVRTAMSSPLLPLELALLRTLAGRVGEVITQCRLHQEVVAASRAKDEFLAMLGHELRNPIAAIRDAARALEGLGHAEEHAAGLLAIVARQAQHVSRLVDDLLDLSRVDTGKLALRRERVQLGDLANRCVATLEAMAPARGRQLTVQADPIEVEGDRARLEQILGNLLDNAVKHTPPGGRITVTVHRHAGSAVLRVEDTGAGIAPELLLRVFDLFAQGAQPLDRGRGGLGIGLSLVRRLVELHGGRVAVCSDGVGSGTTVEVRLPVADPAAPASDGASGHRPAPRPRRILIVEDHADAREALRMALEAEGHRVDVAGSPAEALARVREAAPDFALVDIGLPGMDGYALARAVRALDGGRHTRLIALTGYGRPEDRRRAREAGFDAHLVKPADPNQLARLLGADPPGPETPESRTQATGD